MARIKLKIGENEIEVDSRDFYVDNQTLGEIIDNISQYMPENQAKIVYESKSNIKIKFNMNMVWNIWMMQKLLNLNLMNQSTIHI